MADTAAMQNQYPLPPPRIYSTSPTPRTRNASSSQQTYEVTKENTPSYPNMVARKPVPPSVDVGGRTLSDAPSSPVKVHHPVDLSQYEPQTARIEDHGSQLSLPNSRSVSGNFSVRELTPPPDNERLSATIQRVPFSGSPRHSELDIPSAFHRRNDSGQSQTYHGHPPTDSNPQYTPHSSDGRRSLGSVDELQQSMENYQPLQYHHQAFHSSSSSVDQGVTSRPESRRLSPGPRYSYARSLPRPDSRSSDLALRGRRLTPDHARARSAHSISASPDMRTLSYVDLLNVPYPQPPPVSAENLGNTQLRTAVGNNASLLSTKQTLEMYRANVKKTNDPAIQYEFAIFMITCAQQVSREEEHSISGISEKSYGSSQGELLKEARHILQRLSDRSYPFAQYYLADGYASGLFNKGKEDYDKAFPLFVSASKHGHAEAGYRAALCHEFGWGTKVDGQRASLFYRQSASKNHPGAMMRLGRACLVGDLGLPRKYREGVKWLKRAVESADYQYNAAPYELGTLHETGYGDDIFQDVSYAAQLFTKSADLGHPEANYRLGDAYEHGKLTCPRDPALSVHFYTGAAQGGHPKAMMALCAWYMVGAEPILEKDENEAYEWARKAAEAGLPKAEYAVGYFTEMGVGCRRDPLEANVWYVRAAEHGDDRAKHRLRAIRAAGTGADPETAAEGRVKGGGHSDGEKKKKFGIF